MARYCAGVMYSALKLVAEVVGETRLNGQQTKFLTIGALA